MWGRYGRCLSVLGLTSAPIVAGQGNDLTFISSNKVGAVKTNFRKPRKVWFLIFKYCFLGSLAM